MMSGYFETVEQDRYRAVGYIPVFDSFEMPIPPLF